MDPLWINLRRWYYSLYRGQRYLVWIAVALFTLTIAGWITHEPEERKTNKPIILNKGVR
jgi:hypothetical protein